MSLSSINNSTVTGMTSTGSTGNTTKTSNNTLNMDDFFSLMVAQLKNQDMYNTMDDTQFIQQMAQFSMVQALADLSAASQTAYGVSLIGKEVTIAEANEDGSISSFSGIVDSVNLFNGNAELVVEGRSYSLSNVMSVKEPNIIIPTNPLITENTDAPKNESTDVTNDSTDVTSNESTETTSGSE